MKNFGVRSQPRFEETDFLDEKFSDIEELELCDWYVGEPFKWFSGELGYLLNIKKLTIFNPYQS